MTRAHLPEGPTLNPEYNWLLVRWTEQTGIKHTPECECCEADLTGKDVHEATTCWVGDCCAEEYGVGEFEECESDCSEYYDYGEPESAHWRNREREDFHSDG